MPRSPAVPRALALALHHRQGCVPACVRARARHVSGRRARGTNRCAACVYARARAQGSRLRFLETHSSRSTRRRKLRGAFRESNDLFFLSLFFFFYGNMGICRKCVHRRRWRDIFLDGGSILCWSFVIRFEIGISAEKRALRC